MSDDAKSIVSAGRRSVSRWIHQVLLAARRARHSDFAQIKKNSTCGMRVPDFAAIKFGEDNSSA